MSRSHESTSNQTISGPNIHTCTKYKRLTEAQFISDNHGVKYLGERRELEPTKQNC